MTMNGLMRKAAAVISVAGFLATAQLGRAHGFGANTAGNGQLTAVRQPRIAAVSAARTREVPKLHTSIGGFSSVHLGMKFP
jgi:hypothetical protein